MPVIRAKPGKWARVFEQLFYLWINPKNARVPRHFRDDIAGHSLIALRRKFGDEKVKFTKKDVESIYRADPAGIRLPESSQMMAQGLTAGAILYCVFRLAIHDESRASVENAIRLVSIYQARNGQPQSRAALMAAWAKYKPLSHFFATFFVDPKIAKSIRLLLGIDVSKRAMAQVTDKIPFNAKNMGAMIRDPKKFVANIEKLASEILPRYFAIAERLRELGEKHYAPGQRIRKRPLLDSKIMWKLPRGFKFPPVKIAFKRLSKPERTALLSHVKSKQRLDSGSSNGRLDD